MDTHPIYKAVLRREKGSWWLCVPTTKGSMITMALNKETHGSFVSDVRLPAPIASALGPLLEHAAPVSEAPAFLEVSDDWSELETKVGVDIQYLLSVWWPRFVEQDGCIFRLENGGEIPAFFTSDKTGAELDANHFHLDDVFRDDKGHCLYELTKYQCFQIAEMWMIKLKRCFPRRYFAMYLFMDNENTNLRFQTLRPPEPIWVDPVLVFEHKSDQSAAVWFF